VPTKDDKELQEKMELYKTMRSQRTRRKSMAVKNEELEEFSKKL
jgi:hypothetical protein